jgi:hypothetical protein
MKSHTLARLLLDNPNVEVVQSKDAEGNNFSPLHAPDFDQLYVPESTYHGYLWELDPEEPDGPPADAVQCVVMWPVN